MTTPDQIQSNTALRGILSDHAVSIVNIQWIGSGALELAQQIYTVCEHERRAAEVRTYNANALANNWPETMRPVGECTRPRAQQAAFFGERRGLIHAD